MATRELKAVFSAENRQFLRAAHAVRGALGATIKATVLAAAAGATAYIYAAKRMADYGDEIAKAAKKTGFASDELQRLKYVAQLSGSDIEGLEAASRRMSSVIEDMRNGLSTAKDAFDALGLSLDDVAALPAEQQFLRFLEALAEIKDESRRSALAQDIFGRGGTALLPMISEGVSELHRLRKEADKFAPILTADELRNAERFNDNITRLQYALRKMLWTGLAGGIPEMADALGSLAEKVAEIAESEGFMRLRDQLNGIVKIATDFATSPDGLQALEKIAESVVEVLEAAVKTATFLVEQYAKAVEAMEGVGATLTPERDINKETAGKFLTLNARERLANTFGIGPQSTTGDLMNLLPSQQLTGLGVYTGKQMIGLLGDIKRILSQRMPQDRAGQ